eukprot:g9185.t1
MPFSLKNKSAIITGAASGIGLAISTVFAGAEAHVCMLDLNLEALNNAKTTILRQHPNASISTFQCNVTNEEEVKKVFNQVVDKFGRLDCLVNNAGISAVGTVLETTKEEMDRVYNVNVIGVFYGLKHGVRHMLSDGKGGAIVNLASIASLIGLADRFAYHMTKGAVLTMTLSVATDFVKKGVRCNCVAPGRVHTPFVDNYLKNNYPGQEAEKFKEFSEYQPMGRMGKPTEIANLILYLCSDESAFVTGSCYPIDGGVTARM